MMITKLFQCMLLGSLIIIAFIESSYSQQEFYDVELSQSYSWGRGYPQSCQCVETGVSSSDCELFKCSCVCDLRAGFCDYGCCCDPDCTSDQIGRFNDLEVCRFEGHESSTVQECYSSVELYGVNPRSPLGGDSTSRDAVSQALCVEQTNNDILEDFFTDTALRPSSVFDQAEGRKEYSYIPRTSTVVQTVDNNYDQNDSIAVFYNYSDFNLLLSDGPGFFGLPAADFTGFCNDQNFVTFENKIDSSDRTCQRLLSTDEKTFSSQCENQFSIQRYVTNLWVARDANIRSTTALVDTTNLINVILKTVTFEDFITKDKMDVTNIFLSNSCKTEVISTDNGENLSLQDLVGNNSSTSCFFESLTSVESLDLFLNTSSICNSMITSITYLVNHTNTAEGSISSVSAAVIISDVPMEVSGDSPTILTQSFGVDFISSDPNDVSNTNGNRIERPRSGNPGYLVGEPILFGFAVNDTIINQLTEGLTIPIPTPSTLYNTPPDPDGRVSSCTDLLGGNSGIPVEFGFDVVTGCTMLLNYTAFVDFCCAGSVSCAASASSTGLFHDSPFVDSSTGLPYFFNFSSGYVGNYGNADPLDAGQWQRMPYTVPADSRTWNEETATCSGLYTDLQIQFLTAPTGSRANPQRKILSSRARVRTSNVRFRITPGDQVSTMSVPLTVTVSFVAREDNEVIDYVPPAPPALFTVPRDVFYPFLSSGVEKNVLKGKVVLLSTLSVFLLFCSFI